MQPIKCFLLEPTDRVTRALRRFTYSSDEPDESERGTCPLRAKWGHDAQVPIEDGPAVWGDEGTYLIEPMQWPHDDPRWPTHCECGYEFQEDDQWQLSNDLIYRRADTGEEMTLRDAPAGAMWYAPWIRNTWQGPDGKCLIVRLPERRDWIVDSQASNCGMPDDPGQLRHHCWVRHGVPPEITVDKAGATCSAGAGSIATDKWHGFLRGGYLVVA